VKRGRFSDSDGESSTLREQFTSTARLGHWLALASPTKKRYTQEVPLASSNPGRRSSGAEDNPFQTLGYAEPQPRKSMLVRIKSADLIPMENAPKR
jgi:hypothetical protein